jgi:16S rRNA (uracil1498-N3)-methyltransferase
MQATKTLLYVLSFRTACTTFTTLLLAGGGTGKSSFGMAFRGITTARHALRPPPTTTATRDRFFHCSTACRLNRFLFDHSELIHRDENGKESDSPYVMLPKDDYRTIHAAKTLGLQNGDTVRAGLVGCQESDGDSPNNKDNHNDSNNCGLLTDQAIIEWIPEGKVKKAEPLANGDPPGSLLVRLESLEPPGPIYDQLLVSLILALPRPLQLGRMLPMISQMGVDHLVLTRARKVPKDYFGSHLFRKPEELRERLIEGLCQAGDVRLPKLHIVKNLPEFMNEGELDKLFPLDSYARVIAHPQRRTSHAQGDDSTIIIEPIRLRDIKFPTASPPRVVIAVGPEGGWEEPEELDEFQQRGFQQITLGSRTLRSDCAVVSLLSLAHDVCNERSQENDSS